MSNHIVLLGDSIFDNKSYVDDGESVDEHLTRFVGRSTKVTLLAVDGATTEDVAPQFKDVPSDVSHVFLSCGGNDALGARSILDGLVSLELLSEDLRSAVVGSRDDLLQLLSVLQQEFRNRYRQVLAGIQQFRCPAFVCTVYNKIPGLEPKYVTALSLFNDVITEEATRAGVSLIDLRLICDDPTDYAPVSPIEPSDSGGRKIARTIARVVSGGSLTVYR
jgi:hypothetical protein